MSRIPGPSQHDPFSDLLPSRTVGPLGKHDAADPSVRARAGDTPGSLGTNDGAAHLAKVLTGARGGGGFGVMASAVSMLADTTLAGAPVKSAAKSSVVITADPDGTVNRYREILLKTQAGRSLFERLPDKTSEGNGVAITIRAGFPEHLNSVGSTTRHTEKNFKPWPPSLHPYETHVTFDVIIDVTKIADNIRACEDRIKRKVTPGTYDLWDDYTGAEVLYHELMAHVDLSQDRIEDYQALLDDLSRKVGLKAGLKLGDFPVTDDRRAKIEHALYGASTTPVKPKYEQTPIAEILRQLDTLRREDREREAREKEAREKAAHPKAKTPAH